MKIGEAIDLEKKLMDISGKRLPVKVSYSIARNLSELQKISESFESARLSMIRQYGEKDANGEILSDDQGNVKISNMNAFIVEMTNLLDSEEEISIRKIPVEELEKCDESNEYDSLSISDIQTLEFMLVG